MIVSSQQALRVLYHEMAHQLLTTAYAKSEIPLRLLAVTGLQSRLTEVKGDKDVLEKLSQLEDKLEAQLDTFTQQVRSLARKK
jgi:hypothetical protein